MGTATSNPVGPVTAPSLLNVRIVSQTSSKIVIGWDTPSWQEGYIPTIDGSQILTDGKRHASTSRTASSFTISKAAGGTHSYGVIVLGERDSGSVSA